MSEPLVSILMPVKNEERFIRDSINSIINQTYSNIELIIVDDGSTDQTINLLQSYEDLDWIFIIKTEGVGKNAAFNLAFENSNGDFICYFAGDDIMYANSVEIRVNRMIQEQATEVFLLSKLKILSDDKKHNGQVLPKAKNLGNATGGSLMFTRKLIDNIFPLPLSLANEDLWSNLYCKLFNVHIIHLPIVTYELRLHDSNSYSNFKTFKERSIAMHKREIAYGIFLEKFKDKLSNEQKYYLSMYHSLENLRFYGCILSIVFLKGITLRHKIRALFYSNAFMYKFRIWFSFLFSGKI